MSVREGVLVCVCVCGCLSCCVSVRLKRTENKKETDTNRQYVFLICPLRETDKEQDNGCHR